MASEVGDEQSATEQFAVPKAVFIEDMDEYLKSNGYTNYLEAGRALEELYQKYKFMESNLFTRKIRLLQQLPDIRKTLEIVRHLKANPKPFDSTFEVADQLYARAHVDNVDRVGLWLGANVMLEYDLDEAEEILEKNEKLAEKQLTDVDHNLDFLKEQTTTVEVNLARLHNLNVKMKRQQNQKS